MGEGPKEEVGFQFRIGEERKPEYYFPAGRFVAPERRVGGTLQNDVAAIKLKGVKINTFQGWQSLNEFRTYYDGKSRNWPEGTRFGAKLKNAVKIGSSALPSPARG